MKKRLSPLSSITRLGVWFLGLLLAVSCGPTEAKDAQPEASQPVDVTAAPLVRTGRSCSGAFITHELEHTTSVPGGDEVRMFEANGGGVAINDLDNDGDLDIVLANHAAPNTILWNEGSLSFRMERMAHGHSRAVNIVDVDDDGHLDIVFTRRASAPNYWHNEGNQMFSLQLLPHVARPLYVMNWADLDGDSDLDFVGATYDAGLLTEFGYEFLASSNAGVYYYENEAGKFTPTRLAGKAQALALVLLDLNADNRLDILVGNDFAVPDYSWVRQGDTWVETDVFPTTTHSTMSFDFGDIDNNGNRELFATDMKPYADDPETLAAWHPVLEDLDDPRPEGDPQVKANVLQVSGGDNLFQNEAEARGIDATGWSWSAKFGDLDQDGFLDLYVVNGFIEFNTFGHLPNHELVEENQVLRNDGSGRFVPMPSWNLGATQSGRGMSMGDLDMDGDLDIVVNNLRGPAQLFENQLCQGQSLQVDLVWPESGNGRAIGATLTLHTSNGTYTRDMRTASGYLSGDPARIHFGFPNDTMLKALAVRWPDGRVSQVNSLQPQTRLTIMAGSLTDTDEGVSTNQTLDLVHDPEISSFPLVPLVAGGLGVAALILVAYSILIFMLSRTPATTASAIPPRTWQFDWRKFLTIDWLLVLNRRLDLVSLLFLFWALFWGLNGGDHFIDGTVGANTESWSRTAAIVTEEGEIEYYLHPMETTSWYGVNRDAQMINYFEQLGWPAWGAVAFLVGTGMFEIVLGGLFSVLFVNSVVSGKEKGVTLLRKGILPDLAFKASALVFMLFAVGDILFGDRTELWSHATYFTMVLVSYHIYAQHR